MANWCRCRLPGRPTDGVSAADHQRLGVFLDGLGGDPHTLVQHVRLTGEVVHRVTVPGDTEIQLSGAGLRKTEIQNTVQGRENIEILFGRQQALHIQE